MTTQTAASHRRLRQRSVTVLQADGALFLHTQLTLQILNVWKPVDRPISAWPLAVCDAATMAPDDLLVVGGSEPYEGRPVQSISASWSPQQAWYAMRDQTAAEVRLE